jgi:hypothetical protein
MEDGNFVTHVTPMYTRNFARIRALALAGSGCAGMQNLHARDGHPCCWFMVISPPPICAA